MRPEIIMLICMAMFGSNGLFVRNIPLEPSLILFYRVLLGSLLLSVVVFKQRKRFDWRQIAKGLPMTLLSGVALSFNWYFFFRAYKFTTISLATLAYYTAPVLIILLSVLVLKEKFDKMKLLGIAAVLLGMLMVNGVDGSGTLKGFMFGLLAACFYALMVLFNKFIRGVPGLLITYIQLLVAVLLLLPLAILDGSGPLTLPAGMGLVNLLFLGLVNTGIACWMYFSSLAKMSGQTAAILSYIDPVSALFFSAIFLSEGLSGWQWLGALLILGGAAFGQLYRGKQEAIVS